MAVREPEVVSVIGRARVDRRTKDLARRLLPGEIAVIDHEDLDRVAVDELINAGALAVVNAAASISGRYPNQGPILLIEAGIPLLDGVGTDAMVSICDGDFVAVEENRVTIDGVVVASGCRQTLAQLDGRNELARRSLGETLARFASNTLEYVKVEHHLVTDDPAVPDLGSLSFAGRHALVVVRGIDHREDLAALKRSGYLKEVRPVLIGVDGGADAIVEMGLKPDVIIGDFDSVDPSTLACGARLIVHAYRNGSAPGASRLDAMGLKYSTFVSTGTSEDTALLMAHQLGAELIVAVGSHSTMEDFLDKGREGMASTFLVRLRVGDKLMDAKGVGRLYRPVVRTLDLSLLVVAMLASLGAATVISRPIQLWIKSLWLLVRTKIGR